MSSYSIYGLLSLIGLVCYFLFQLQLLLRELLKTLVSFRAEMNRILIWEGEFNDEDKPKYISYIYRIDRSLLALIGATPGAKEALKNYDE